MAEKTRWNSAQVYEKRHWATKALTHEGSDLSWYQWRARKMLKNIADALDMQSVSFAGKNVLEVGSGPVGVVSALGAEKKIAVDPLCDFYSSQKALTQYRGENVKYLNVRGEELPFEAASFDLVIVENVIDHVENIHKVMSEISRVIRSGGILYLTVNLHPFIGYFLHRAASRLQIDRGHPHTFTIEKIRKFIQQSGFEIQYDSWEGFKECWRNDFQSDSFRRRLKAASGLSEFLYTSVSTVNRNNHKVG
ncbi:Ubiquinone/menaquinone biosynthesis C-methylase UbiE [Desulfocicer vacuolatum DSM 3385]|uniref:Ubiquinone/menaquinone biosynthesis C-methylase UbiE n=1 Tax=Desulfocicer vacuolatum DSM 3385 TaxID=1121400 RepID=A0A1W1ZNQ3_9BACT|nr:class I SAM-dependent methyltransferase [Desulfocicer vacuolatum]SMC50200.1 Ubiquinone/menaquinone biosynthesis C-methylase UbiE [Desulfocicer vacuolatum DSM 3385]